MQKIRISFSETAAAFAKLLELGIQRDSLGRIIYADNKNGGYHAAPKKKSKPGASGKTSADKVNVDEARPLARENMQFRAKL